MLWRRRRPRSDFAEEIRSHLDLDADALIRDGVPPDEAHTLARRRFGSVTAARERHYEFNRVIWLDELSQDIRSAGRSLAKYPIATAVAILSLAAGIGISTATLAIRDTVFRNPPPLYQAPEQLSEIFTVTPRGFRQSVPAALYRIWTAERRGDQIWGAATLARREDVRTSDGTETLSVRAVTPKLFALFGVQTILGNAFADRADPASVVISYPAWQRLFAGRRDVVGQPLWIGEQVYQVAGVMPDRFWILETGGYVWTPLDISRLPADARLTAWVRRPPGLSQSALKDTLATGLAEYARALPEAERTVRADLTGIGGTPIGRAQSIVFPYLLGACVVLVWLIACANVAILMIARWTAREHEIAVESLIVAVAGGALGICTTFALRGLLVYNAGPIIANFDTSVKPHVLLDAVVLTIVTGLLAGVGPALYETRRLIVNPLRMLTSERLRQRWRHGLVIAEITVTAALLVVTGQMLDGYRRQASGDVGFATDNLIGVRIDSPTGVQAAAVLDYLENLPGVATAAMSTSAPFIGGDSTLHSVSLGSGRSSGIQAEAPRVSETFFSTLGVAVRAGRAFSTADAGPQPTVAMVNETLARQLWPVGTPIGSRVWLDDRAYDVIGVAADYLDGPLSKVVPAVYLPLSTSSTDSSLRFLLRTPTAAEPLIAGLRREIPKVAKGHVIGQAFAANDLIALGAREILAGTVPLVPMITIGLLLTVSGVYAVLAFAVARRSKEFALRTALGASKRDVVRLVATHSLRLVTIGSVLGVAATFALTRVVRASGGGGSIFDTPGWPAFAVPMLLMIAVGTLATWIPCRRALHADPAALLRVD